VQVGDFEGFRFAPDGTLIILAGSQGPNAAGPIMGGARVPFRALDFWSLDLKSGKIHRLTQLKPGYSVRSFDISSDGREILFDRVQENSDLVLIDRQKITN
jgi:hypothetical protein